MIVCRGDADGVFSKSRPASANDDVHSGRRVGEGVYCVSLYILVVNDLSYLTLDDDQFLI